MFDMFEITIIGLAILALLTIVFEEITHINKAKTTLFLGCLVWCLLFIRGHGSGQAEIESALNENLLEIAKLWLFLMATMTFVAYLNARGLIGAMVNRLLPGELSLRKLTLLVALFALVLSMLCDNITATLVSISIILAFKLEVPEKVKLCVLIIFAVNSGGVVLITGDVTTLMIFSEKHVSIVELLGLILPAISGVVVLALLMSFGKNRRVEATIGSEKFKSLDFVIAGLFFGTICCTMLFNLLFAIPPVLTFLLGLSVMFMIGGMVNKFKYEIHLLDYVRKIQFDTLMFFLGILLIVGSLKEIGVLVWMTNIYFMLDPDYSNYLVGILSAFLDNVPLTAALLKAQPELTNIQWLSLTYAVGVGGSMLVIGSAAGIVAMSRVKELTFVSYSKYIVHLLVAYSVGYALCLVNV
ncbi:sodium:proton antiporter NhaD [Aliiglaciecola sp. NS0011-25]